MLRSFPLPMSTIPDKTKDILRTLLFDRRDMHTTLSRDTKKKHCHKDKREKKTKENTWKRIQNPSRRTKHSQMKSNKSEIPMSQILTVRRTTYLTQPARKEMIQKIRLKRGENFIELSQIQPLNIPSICGQKTLHGIALMFPPYTKEQSVDSLSNRLIQRGTQLFLRTFADFAVGVKYSSHRKTCRSEINYSRTCYETQQNSQVQLSSLQILQDLKMPMSERHKHLPPAE